MRSMTYKFSFVANNRTEMLQIIKDKISLVVGNELEDPLKYVNYETTITDYDKDKKYLVEVIARVTNDNR